MKMSVRAACLLAFLIALVAGFVYAQTPPADVNNPSAVTWTPSLDNALVDSYELDLLKPDGSFLQTLNLGKPPVDAATNTQTAPINVQPILFAVGYSARIRAKAGTASSLDTVSSNKFNRIPGGPTKVTFK